MKLAPVAMFVFNRTDTVRMTMEALLANTLSSGTRLYVFSDGGRDQRSWHEVNEVRRYLHEVREQALQGGLSSSVP